MFIWNKRKVIDLFIFFSNVLSCLGMIKRFVHFCFHCTSIFSLFYSFLSEQDVYQHLEEFLQNAQTLVEQRASSTSYSALPTLVQFSLLIIHCLEVIVFNSSFSLVIECTDLFSFCYIFVPLLCKIYKDFRLDISPNLIYVKVCSDPIFFVYGRKSLLNVLPTTKVLWRQDYVLSCLHHHPHSLIHVVWKIILLKKLLILNPSTFRNRTVTSLQEIQNTNYFTCIWCMVLTIFPRLYKLSI